MPKILEPEDDYEEDVEYEAAPPKKKGKGVDLGGMFIVFIFILGFVLGSFIAIKYVQPFLAEQSGDDPATLKKTIDALDDRVDRMESCMQRKNLDPDSCQYES